MFKIKVNNRSVGSENNYLKARLIAQGFKRPNRKVVIQYSFFNGVREDVI